MKFKEKIEAAQQKLDQLKSDVAEMMGIAEAEERDLTGEESTKLEAFSEEIEATTKRIEDLEKAEKALGTVAVKQAPGIIKKQGLGRDRKPGEILFKQATATLIGHYLKQSPLQVASERYAHDHELLEVVKSTVNPAQTDVSGWAEELVDSALQGFQDILRGESIAGGLLAEAGTQLQFDRLGSITVPSRAGSDTDLSSGFVGEGGAIPVKKGSLSPITIAPYKWGVISTFSKELQMRSTPAIEALVRQFIIDDTSTQLDNDFFGTAAAVAGERPAGMFNGVAGTAGSSTTALADRIIEDLNALATPILTAKMGRRMRILLNPVNASIIANVRGQDGFIFRSEINSGRLGMHEVRQSHNVPVDEIWAIDMREVAWAPGVPVFTASDSATIVEADDDGVAPEVSSVDVAARDTVNTPKIRSLFQTETVALKHVQYLSWHKMRAGCVNRIHTIDYTS
ncbi:phage major capsid protein [Parahaliea mediterranea]|uniref:phage major capsid protein n=1 Tax=Parahaliea mediterranea TaxID=651086 RepID=UPI000E2EED6B|nr:phage major capsid protein [Parahaliea mediterranea]